MKRFRSFASAVLLASAAIPALAGQVDMVQGLKACVAVNGVAGAGRLKEYTDPQLERAMCVLSQVAVQAITQKREVAESECIVALEHLMREFKRRFPDRDHKSVTNKC